MLDILNILNWLDIVLLLILAVFVVSGFRRGLMRQLLDLGGFIIALYLAWALAPQLSAYLAQFSNFVPEFLLPGDLVLAAHLSSIVISILSFLFVYFVVTIFFKFFGKLLHGIASLPVIGFFNAVGGAALGGLKGLIWVFVAVVIISFLPVTFLQELTQESFFSAVVATYFPLVIDIFKEIIPVKALPVVSCQLSVTSYQLSVLYSALEPSTLNPES